MKSIFDQYKSVNEGILSESQFLRNVKMALPKFISNVSSFKDAVRILKSKGIITEAKIQESMGERLADETYDELGNMLSSGKITQDQYNKIDDYLNDNNYEVFEGGNFYDDYSVIEYVLKQLQMNVSLNEAKTEYDTHYCNPQEYNLGMRYELGKGTDEEKAHKIVYKNLKENAVYYSQLHLAGYNEDAMKKDRKKRTDLPIEVKKDNFVDAANGVKKVKMDKLTEDELKVLIGNILTEALNKDIKAFGQDVERNLKSAGFNTLVTTQTPTDEQTNQVINDPKLVILYVSQDSSSQGLQLRGNITAAKDLSKIVNKFQVSSWNGPKKEFGSDWDAKTKQVVGGFNPGDIVGVKDPDSGISGKKFYDAGFYRYAKVDTTVRTNESLAEVADQKKTNLNESIEDNIAQIVNDKSSKYTFYNDKHKADMQKIFRMSAIKQILKNPNLTDEDKQKLETELAANKPEIKPTTQVSYPDSLADLIRQSSLD
jgi:hypothetical protein